MEAIFRTVTLQGWGAGQPDTCREASYREASYREVSYREASYREARYREASYREASYREARYREASHNCFNPLPLLQLPCEPPVCS